MIAITRKSVLEILEKNREFDISGEKLAQSLSISRSAVHKSIKELRQDGYIINATTKRGYRLSEKNDIISSEGIKAFLNEEINIPNILVYKTLKSTNQTAKQLALNGESSGCVVIADEQTDGRGRMGRSFYSPAGTGIYMSIILRPKMLSQKGILITTLSSVAVCCAIEKVFNVKPKIKWVNDIILSGKKICGILTEAVTDFESGSIEHVVLGIGINFTTHSFPKELKDIAYSLQTENEYTVIRNKLIAEILIQFFTRTKDIEEANFIEDYKKRSIVIGREIEITMNNEKICCTAIDIDSMGGLVVQMKDGCTTTLSSGEISIKGDYSYE